MVEHGGDYVRIVHLLAGDRMRREKLQQAVEHTRVVGSNLERGSEPPDIGERSRYGKGRSGRLAAGSRLLTIPGALAD
jgi:hypothetical protein